MNIFFKIENKILFYIMACFIIFSCTKMDSTYKDFLKDGEIIYAGMIDSFSVNGGNGRVQLTGLYPSDRKVQKVVVYWNNKKDSITENILPSSSGSKVWSRIIDGINEGRYTFEALTVNHLGNTSRLIEAIGSSYGELYNESLNNRMVKNYLYSAKSLTIDWYPATEDEIKTSILYMNNSGQEREAILSPDMDQIILSDFKNGTKFFFKSGFLPELNAIDTFYSKIDSVLVVPIEVRLNSDLFIPLILPGDAQPQNASHSLSRLWNGNLGAGGDYRTNNNSVMPQHYNWDLGVSAVLRKIRVYQRGANAEPNLLYKLGNPRYYEIWGSNDPDGDGSFAGWIKLLDCESIKPSGGDNPDVEEIDRDYAQPGEVFEFPEGTPSVRYIRMNFLETWGQTKYNFLNEVVLYGILD